MFSLRSSLLVAAIAVSASSPHAEEMILGLRVNGSNRGEVVVDVGPDKTLTFADEEAVKFGFTPAALDRLRLADGKVQIRATSQLVVNADLEALTLQMDAPADWFATTRISLSSRGPVKVGQLEGWHGWLNYAVDLQQATGADADARIDTQLVVARGSWSLYSEQVLQRLLSRPALQRSATTLFRDDAAGLTRLAVGDVTPTRALGSTTPRIRGIQWSRRYDLDPSVIATPAFSWQYNVTSPSTVDVFVDQNRVRSFNVGAGPLNLADLTYFAGLRTVEIVVRNRAGAETRIALPYYFTNDLLAAGRSQFDIALGSAPDASGAQRPVMGGAARWGLSERLTVGTGGEAKPGYVAVRMEAAARDEQLGQLQIQTATSRRSDDAGYRTALAVVHALSRDRLAWQASYLQQRAGFGLDRQPSETQTLLVRQATASLAVALTPRHGVSLNAALSNYANAPRSKTLGARLSQSWGSGLSSWLALLHSQQNGVGRVAVSAGLSMALGPRWSVSAGGEARSDGTSEWSVRGARSGGDEGWNNLRIASAARQGAVSAEGYVERPLSGATLALAARAEQRGGAPEFAVNGRLSGALVVADGGYWLSQAISQSFALVEVPSANGVRVYHNSQLVGRTAADGRIVLPNLASYAANQIRIDDRDIPLDVELGNVQQEVAPRSYAGIPVRFTGRTVAAVGGTLVTRAGNATQPVMSAQLTISALGAAADSMTSSTDGQGGFYIDGLAIGRWKVLAVNRSVRCEAELEIAANGAVFKDLGELQCIATH